MLGYSVYKVGLAGKEPAKPKVSRMDLRLSKNKLCLAALNWAKISLSYVGLANRAAQLSRCRKEFRLAQEILA